MLASYPYVFFAAVFVTNNPFSTHLIGVFIFVDMTDFFSPLT